jgi:hypothetical protein
VANRLSDARNNNEVGFFTSKIDPTALQGKELNINKGTSRWLVPLFITGRTGFIS